MTGRVENKVALITGAARGQGRRHAVRLAQEGADVIAIDICHDLDSVGYPLARAEDLRATVKEVEGAGRRIVALEADVRDRGALAEAVHHGVDQLGRLDIVVANAGIAPLGAGLSPQAFIDAVSVNYVGVVNTFDVTFPFLTAGASIIATGSTASMRSGAVEAPHNGPGGLGYRLSKKEVARLVDVYARVMGPSRVRVNAVHPTNVRTDMFDSDVMRKAFRPDLDAPTTAEADASAQTMHPWPDLAAIDVDDVSDAVVFLASDESRFVTGLQLTIDGGSLSGTLA